MSARTARRRVGAVCFLLVAGAFAFEDAGAWSFSADDGRAAGAIALIVAGVLLALGGLTSETEAAD